MVNKLKLFWMSSKIFNFSDMNANVRADHTYIIIIIVKNNKVQFGITCVHTSYGFIIEQCSAIK